jgi:hypothetical protein
MKGRECQLLNGMYYIFVLTGVLTEAYDELGNQYKVPVYCLSRPLNLLCEDFDENAEGSVCVEEHFHKGKTTINLALYMTYVKYWM